MRSPWLAMLVLGGLAWTGAGHAAGTEFGGMVLGSQEDNALLLDSLRAAPALRWIRGQTPGLAARGFQPVDDVRRLMPRAWDLAPGELPDDLLGIRDAVQAGVEATPGTRVWEVWNEPDFHFVDDSAAKMAAVLKASWWGVKTARAADRVLMPSLAFRPGRYAVELMQNGAASWTDGYNLHFYGWPSDYATVLASHRVLAEAAGIRVPWWVTEIGFFQMGVRTATDVEALAWQAAFHERAMVESVAHGMAVHLAFALSPAREASWDLGLSEPGGRWRPALKAMARLAPRLGEADAVAHLVHRDSGETLGVALSEVDDPESRWLVFWSAARPREALLPGVRGGPVFPDRFPLRLEWPPGVTAVRAGIEGAVSLAPEQVPALELQPGQVHHLRIVGSELPRVEGCAWHPRSQDDRPRRSAGLSVRRAWRRELKRLPPRVEPSPVVVHWRTGPGWVADKPSQAVQWTGAGAGDVVLELVNLSTAPVSGHWTVERPDGWEWEGAAWAAEGEPSRLAPSSASRVGMRLRPAPGAGRCSEPARLTVRWRDDAGRGDVASLRLVRASSAEECITLRRLAWRDAQVRAGHPEGWQVFEPEPGRVHLEVAETAGAQGDVVVRWEAPRGLRARDAFVAQVRPVTTRGRVHAQFFLATRDGEIWRHDEWRALTSDAPLRVRAVVDEVAPTLWSRQRTFGSPDAGAVRWALLRLQGARAGDVFELRDLAWVRQAR